MRFLLIEDDMEAAKFVASSLAQLGHEVNHYVDGQEGLVAALGGGFDVLLIDRRLPSLDGISIARRLRAADIKTPLIFLTTMDGIDDRVDGLDAGADDYLVKPISMSELRARIDAVMRRYKTDSQPATYILVGDVKIDLVRRIVRREGNDIHLQPQEFKLLEFLARNKGQVATKSMLLEHVWGLTFDPKTNIIESHISRLRSKIDKSGAASFIETVRGAGYMIRAA